MLYILGSTLFVDKIGTQVPMIYLQLLTDLDPVDTYAWVCCLGIVVQTTKTCQSGFREVNRWLYDVSGSLDIQAF